MKKMMITTTGIVSILALFFATPIKTIATEFDIFVFGDSLSDVGSDFNLTHCLLGIAIPPLTRYGGSNYPGRFSNGPNWVDYLASELGLTLKPLTVDPSCEPTLIPSANNGISLAHGGAGTGQSNLIPGVALSVPGVLGQIDIFRRALNDTPQTADSETLFIVWGGANDYFFGGDDYVTPGLTDNPADVVINLVTAVEELFALGARNFLVLNLPDLGETPFGLPNATDLNARTAQHNHLLVLALLDLNKSLTGINLFFLDTNTLFKDILANPTKFGFAPGVVAGPAAGCLFPPFDCSPVDLVTDYIFWDEMHPTTAMHDLIGQAALEALAIPIAAVALDIMPDSTRNWVFPRFSVPIWVAILTTNTANGDPLDFDATQVDPASIGFGPGKATMFTHLVTDVDRDGDADFLAFFNTEETGIACGDTEAILIGKTFAGQTIISADSITTVGCYY